MLTVSAGVWASVDRPSLWRVLLVPDGSSCLVEEQEHPADQNRIDRGSAGGRVAPADRIGENIAKAGM
jgi:hypothetical protein